MSELIIPAQPGWFLIYGVDDHPQPYLGSEVLAWRITERTVDGGGPLFAEAVTTGKILPDRLIGYLRPDGQAEVIKGHDGVEVFEDLEELTSERNYLFETTGKAEL